MNKKTIILALTVLALFFADPLPASQPQTPQVVSADQGQEPLEAGMITGIVYIGAGKYDFVGANEKLVSNLNPDHQIDLSIEVDGVISEIQVRRENNTKTWDTASSKQNWLVAVTDGKGERMNKNDGAVAIAVSGSADFSLWFEEDSANGPPYRVTFMLADGGRLEAVTGKRGEKRTFFRQKVAGAEQNGGIVFLAAKPVLVKTDLVGKNKKPAGNGAQDTSIKCEVTGNGKITAATLADASSMGWDTLTSNNGRWLLGLRDSGKLLNKANGTVEIEVQEKKTLELLMQDNGKLRAGSGTFTLSLTWEDGSITSQQLTW